MSKRLAALVAGAILTALTVAAPALATTHRWPGPAQSGRIVWTQVLDSNFTTARLVSARPDSRGFRVLTHPGPKRFDIDAVVSPGGGQVLFERDLPSGRSVLGMVSAAAGECTSSRCAARTPARGWTTPAGRRRPPHHLHPGHGAFRRRAGRPARPCCTPPARTAAGAPAVHSAASTASTRTTTPGSTPAAGT